MTSKSSFQSQNILWFCEWLRFQKQLWGGKGREGEGKGRKRRKKKKKKRKRENYTSGNDSFICFWNFRLIHRHWIFWAHQSCQSAWLTYFFQSIILRFFWRVFCFFVSTSFISLQTYCLRLKLLGRLFSNYRFQYYIHIISDLKNGK